MDRRIVHDTSSDDLVVMVKRLAERMDRVEARLGLGPLPSAAEEQGNSSAQAVEDEPSAGPVRESLEFEVGQNWFAVIGIVALAMGMAFVLSLKFANWPPALPSFMGYGVCAILFGLARISQTSFVVVSKFLRAACMLLLFFSTLRFFFFGDVHSLTTASAGGRGLLLGILILNLGVAWLRKSPYLFILALLTGLITALVVGSLWFFLGTLTALVALAVHVQVRMNWRFITPVMVPFVIISYVIWAIGNPLLGEPLAIRGGNPASVYFILAWMILFSVAVMLRPDREREDSLVQISGLLPCSLGFGVFFLHNLLAHQESFLAAHVAASVIFLAIAVAFWIREQSWFSTFLYAMTGYAALSLALIKGFPVPQVFVALSLQSLVVIATAIWFRSRFIIVANSIIFVGIIFGYLSVVRVEAGLIIGFGIVALVSARILNWKRDRLELKTEMMRNANLTIAFLVFPYGLYHMVPEYWVAVTWIGLALLYYALGIVIHTRKYRWMGHMTLLLTVLFVLIIGTSRLETTHRILTLLVLGSILLIVSLIFTLRRARHHRTGNQGEQGRKG